MIGFGIALSSCLTSIPDKQIEVLGSRLEEIANRTSPRPTVPSPTPEAAPIFLPTPTSVSVPPVVVPTVEVEPVPTRRPRRPEKPVETPIIQAKQCDTTTVYTTAHGVNCTRHPEAKEDCKVLRKGDGKGGFLGINSSSGVYKVLLPAKFTCRVLPAQICGPKGCVELSPTPNEWNNPDEEGSKRYCRLHYAAKANAKGIIRAIGSTKGELKVTGDKGVCSLTLDLTKERND